MQQQSIQKIRSYLVVFNPFVLNRQVRRFIIVIGFLARFVLSLDHLRVMNFHHMIGSVL